MAATSALGINIDLDNKRESDLVKTFIKNLETGETNPYHEGDELTHGEKIVVKKFKKKDKNQEKKEMVDALE